MKAILLPIVAIVAGAAAFAQAQPAEKIQPAPSLKQEGSQDEFKKKLDDKLKKPFFKKANWILDYDQARAEAKKANKVIFTYFSRSYSP